MLEKIESRQSECLSGFVLVVVFIETTFFLLKQAFKKQSFLVNIRLIVLACFVLFFGQKKTHKIVHSTPKKG